jgi:DNA-binding MarR family transcriptional regulator
VKLTSHHVLRSLSRFDAATVEDLASALHHNPSRTVWVHLQKLVASGLVSREGEHGTVARYAITEQGRMAIRRAA